MLNVICRSFFLHDPQLAQFMRAVARGQDTSHIRFPWNLPSQEKTVVKLLFDTLKDKLTHQHLKQIAPSKLAHKHRTRFATLLMEKGATQILMTYPRLGDGLDLQETLTLLFCAADTATPKTARDLLGYIRVLLKQAKQKHGPYKMAYLLLDHSTHYGPNLLCWAYRNFLINDHVLNTILDITSGEKNTYPEVRALFENPNAHTILKRETLFQHLDKHPEDALINTSKTSCAHKNQPGFGKLKQPPRLR